MMDELVMENERLNERVALAAMDATDEEKQAAEVLIAELREEIKMLNIEVKSLRISRDQFQAENAQLKKQVAAQQRQLKKLEA
jgi:regulator of replication initiation timing